MADAPLPNCHNNVLYIDAGIKIGATLGDDDRGRLHTKVSNNADEPIPIGGKLAEDQLAALGGAGRADIITILQCILMELRRMNVQLATVTDDEIKDFDIPRGELR